MALPKIVSLFSGAGGLDLGFYEAGYPIAFAVDKSKWAIKTHRHNFPTTTSLIADLNVLPTESFIKHLLPHLNPGEQIGVIGGPPCQGFSRSNPSATPDDPRNRLPMLYLELVEMLQSRYTVEFVLFENVLGIRDTKNEAVFGEILQKLRSLGFSENVSEYCALDYGVPQLRRRIVISAFKSKTTLDAFRPKQSHSNGLTVRNAISHLPEPAFFSRTLKEADIPFHPNHWTMRPVSRRFTIPWDNSNGARSFRRLSWDKPSPTVAYGHREIHVHPQGHRRLSIYEAMLLQGFPEKFVLFGPLSSQVEQISNAVPPPLAHALARATAEALSI